MSLAAPILNIPLPVIAGAVVGAARQIEILHNISRLARKWNWNKTDGSEKGIRSKEKKRNLLTHLRALRCANIVKSSPSWSQIRRFFVPQRPLKTKNQRCSSGDNVSNLISLTSFTAKAIRGDKAEGGDGFESESFHHEASEQEQEEIQGRNLTQEIERFSAPITLDPEVQKVFQFCRVKNNVKFSDAISYWKQRSATKIAEGSYGEIYQFRHIDGNDRIFKCMPIDGRHVMNSYQNVSLSTAVPDIVASKLLSDLSEGSTCAAPNFPTIYNISLVRDRFPELLMRAWCEYRNSPERLWDPVEHPPPDQYPESQLYLTIESSFCGEPLSIKHLQNAWVGVSIMSQLVTALAAAEAAHNFEHRDLHLANILLQKTPAASLKYTINNQHFSVETVGCHVFIVDFTLSRIYYDKNVYCIGLDDIVESSDDREDAGNNEFLNHKMMYKIMGEMSRGRWETYMPATNVIWLKYMNENILDYLQKNNRYSLPEMTAFRLLCDWNGCILRHMSATDLLHEVISKDNPIFSVYE